MLRQRFRKHARIPCPPPRCHSAHLVGIHHIIYDGCDVRKWRRQKAQGVPRGSLDGGPTPDNLRNGRTENVTGLPAWQRGAVESGDGHSPERTEIRDLKIPVPGFKTRRSLFEVHRSTSEVQRSTPEVQRSTCDSGFRVWDSKSHAPRSKLRVPGPKCQVSVARCTLEAPRPQLRVPSSTF